MAEPSSSVQYFLGVNGQQEGPFSEAQVRQKIVAGMVPADCLVWFEGLTEWQPLSSIPALQADPAKQEAASPDEGREERTLASIPAAVPSGKFKPLGSAPVSSTPVISVLESDSGASAPESGRIPAWKKKQKTLSAPTEDQILDSFAPQGQKPRAIFDKTQSVIGHRLSPIVLLSGTATFLVTLLIVGYVVFSGGEQVIEKAKETNGSSREARLQEGRQLIIIQPDEGIGILKKLLSEDGADEVALAAYRSLELHFLDRQDFKGMGDLLMSVRQPSRAAQIYLKDPRLVAEAERALFQAYELSTSPIEKKDLLKQDIELLMGPLKKKTLAMERIRQLDQIAGSESHPFKFYVLPLSTQVMDVFDRTSQYFLSGLYAFIEGEFPQMKMISKPVVQIRKEEGNTYRIAGSYRGDVVLYRDRLKNIFIEFWLIDAQWYVVDTNLTSDRQKYAKQKKEKLRPRTIADVDLMRYLESVYEQEYPKTPLHVRVPRETATSVTTPKD